MKKYIYSLLLLFVHGLVIAQDSAGREEVATGMRSEGKIYVVVAVVVTILLGFFLYLIRLDRKITRLEKKNG
jgi:hypothetical protein